MVVYGQVIIGPPGGGKSTYCKVMEIVYNRMGRKAIVVNLDPQVTYNELPYIPAIDICKLIDSNKVANKFNLGPNATLIYCMEYLLANIDWLLSKLDEYKDAYILYDTPGQVELLIHNTSLRDVVDVLQRQNQRLVCVNMMDSTLCADPFKYISGLLSSLSGQIFLQLPHVNILSKLSLLRLMREDLAYRLEYYSEACGLEELIIVLRNGIQLPDQDRFERFTSTLCELIEDYNLVSFGTMDVQDDESINRIVSIIDRTSGYLSKCNNRDGFHLSDSVNDIEERLIN